MALLDVKTRQTYLKKLGFYKGEIDGSVGPLTKQAYKDLQNKYFTRAKDKDGIYGTNTDILLKSAYNCKDSKNFKLTEFRCGCGAKYCTGYPAVVNKNLVENLQTLRSHYGKSITITSGLRCVTHNKNIGGVTGSSHTKGMASDIYIAGGQSNSHTGRVAIVDYWDTLSNAKYAYCNGYMKYVNQSSKVYNSSSMGNAVHCNVK
jgi:peptidoglycan hydrolase-like protein with peptidoglycan-binding domain